MNQMELTPVEYKVLIEVDIIEEQEGLILKPQQVIEREQYGNDKGIIREVGEMAFSDWKGKENPKVGDRVLFNKYKGVMMPHHEVVEIKTEHHTREEIKTTYWRICNDRDILGIFKEKGNGE